MSEINSFLEECWKILNTNFVSSLLGSALFGVVAGWILNHMLGKRERKSLSTQVDLILTKAIKDNLETHDELLKQLNKGSITMVPEPFNVTPLQVILQGKFVEVMPPDLVSELTTAYRYCTMINAHQARFAELATGVASALGNVSTKQHTLIQECLLQMPGLKAAHLRVRKILSKN